MTVEVDPSAQFADFAHPERLVTGDWLEKHLGTPGLVVVESDEDVLLYETGHIPGAVKIDWHTDLNDPVVRDYIDGAGFAEAARPQGHLPRHTVVIYGDKNNWWAAYALWVFTLFGHEDVRLLDGGRAKWEAEGRPYTTQAPAPTPVDYPVVERNDAPSARTRRTCSPTSATRWWTCALPRSTSATAPPARRYPEESALRAGHIPTRAERAVGQGGRPDGTFKPPRRAQGDLPRRRRAQGRRRRDRLLPHRRALQPHLVRPHPPPRLPGSPELRRILDRVGQRRARPDRPRCRAGRGPRPVGHPLDEGWDNR